MGIFEKIQSFLGVGGARADLSAAEDGRKIVHRAFRVNANALQKLNVHEIHDSKVTPLAVTDISTTGIAVMASSVRNAVDVGERLKFRFMIEDKEINADVVVRRKTDTIIGCQYDSGLAEIREALFSTYHPEIIAASMYKVQADNTDRNSEAIWFTGDNNSELYCEIGDQHKLKKLSMIFLGNYFRYPVRDHDDDEPEWNLQYGISAVEGDVDWQDKVPGHVRDFAVRVLRQLRELKEDERNLALEVFGESPELRN